MPYTVRSLKFSDIESVYALYQQMAWEGKKKEWTDLIEYGIETSSVITCDDKVIGVALALPFDRKIRIAGVIITPSHRGRKLGQRVTKHLLEQFKEHSYFELDATPQGKALYEKFHFTSVGTIFTFTKSLIDIPQCNYTLCKQGEFDQIEALDRLAFGASRKAFVERAFHEKAHILITKKQEEITGFILCSEISDNEMRIGPWVDKEVKPEASLLQSALYYCVLLGKKSVSIHILKTNSIILSILNDFNFLLKEETTRMQLRTPPVINSINYYALWSLELG